MASSISIPLQTLTPSQVVNIPSNSIPTGLTHAQLLINRNVGASPLDGAPTATLSFFMEFSQDGGSTWGSGVGASTGGGGALPASDIEVDLPGDPANAQRRVRGSVTNGPVSISVSGSLNLT
jgi:hypothetical protein